MRKELSLTACLMAFVFVFAGAFAGTARAQTGGGQEYVGVPEESFILYQDEKGETVCRPATAEERERIRAAAETHVIYRGAPLRRKSTQYGYEVLEPNAVEDTSGLPLLPSAGLTIVLQGTAQLEANPTAKAAFIVAANRWESIISTPVTITLSVDYGPNFFDQGPYKESGILGQTGSFVIKSGGNDPTLAAVRQHLIENSNATAPELALYNALPADAVVTEFNGTTLNVSNVRVNTSQARALGFNVAPGPDAQIGFNSNFGNGGQFDFDPSDGITPNFTDFDAVVVHEIGHALGFTSAAGGSTLAAVTVWDLFRFRPGAATLGNFGAAQRVMVTGGEQVMFGNFIGTYASPELGLSTGGPSGSSGDGRQSSHWKDDSLNSYRSFIGVMDPTLSRGVRRTITENDIRTIDLLGYSVVFDPQRPANDNFTNAVQLSGASGSYTGTNVWATREPGEPGTQAGFISDKSVWFAWTAPATGTATFTTSGSNFDTTLGVYKGASLNTLDYACVFGASQCTNDDAGNLKTSTVQANVTAGTTYYIDVDGWNSEYGTVVLNWTAAAAATPTPTPTPTPPASFQLASTASTMVEHRGAAGFVVNRTGNLTETTSVNYSITAGTATPSADFVETTGTINFAGGDLYKVVNVKVNDDTALEPSETVIVTLTSAGGGSVVGTPNTATLTILDDDNFPANSVRIAGAAVQTVSEGGGHVAVTVTRSGDTSQPASVDYRTANGTAVGTRDYIFAGGTLDFAAGETTKTFSVLINEDTYVEGDESFTVALSNPARTTLDAAQSSIQVAVQDNDTAASATNPNDVSQSFVRQHYQDFLNREPDADGLAFWTNDIEQCGTGIEAAQCRQVHRINVSAAFFLSIEFQETGYLVYRAYQTAYGSGAKIVPIRYDEMLVESQRISRGVQVGIGNWREQLETNKTAFFNELVDSGRFRAEYPVELTPTQFVDKMIRNAPAYYPQRDSLVAQLTADPSQAGRVAVVRRIAESAAVDASSKNSAFVLMEYFGYMRRNPDDAPDGNFLGYQYWQGKLQQFGGNYLGAEMVKAFLESIEYRTRFAP